MPVFAWLSHRFVHRTTLHFQLLCSFRFANTGFTARASARHSPKLLRNFVKCHTLGDIAEIFL